MNIIFAGQTVTEKLSRFATRPTKFGTVLAFTDDGPLVAWTDGTTSSAPAHTLI